MQRQWLYSRPLKKSQHLSLLQWDYSEHPRNNYSTGIISKTNLSNVDAEVLVKAKLEVDNILRGHLGLRRV